MMEEDQKYFDAMLIRGFRMDMSGTAFSAWVKETFGKYPEDLKLKRCSRFWHGQRVQQFIGSNLRPLADRLWATGKQDDIETLRLLQGRWAGLDCQQRRDRELQSAQRQNKKDDLRAKLERAGQSASYDAHAPNRRPATMMNVK